MMIDVRPEHPKKHPSEKGERVAMISTKGRLSSAHDCPPPFVDRCNPRKFLESPLYVSHVGKSMYAMQLERWFELFGRENFKVSYLLSSRGGVERKGECS